MKIEKSSKIGFCFGVRRALDILDKAVKEHGSAETLGEIVHNKQVVQKLAGSGVQAARTVDEIRGTSVVIGAHGVTPEVLQLMRDRGITAIDTTCPFVRRAQLAAKKLARTGFSVIVFGDIDHPEIKGVLGWAGGKGFATTDIDIVRSKILSKKLGILSQTTQIPARFKAFAAGVLDFAYKKDCEIRIVDTICHDIWERQAATLELAGKVDLMLVVGGRNSANTVHLAELSSSVARTYKIETAEELNPEWFNKVESVGVAAGASTSDDTIDEIVKKIESFKI